MSVFYLNNLSFKLFENLTLAIWNSSSGNSTKLKKTNKKNKKKTTMTAVSVPLPAVLGLRLLCKSLRSFVLGKSVIASILNGN